MHKVCVWVISEALCWTPGDYRLHAILCTPRYNFKVVFQKSFIEVCKMKLKIFAKREKSSETLRSAISPVCWLFSSLYLTAFSLCTLGTSSFCEGIPQLCKAQQKSLLSKSCQFHHFFSKYWRSTLWWMWYKTMHCTERKMGLNVITC